MVFLESDAVFRRTSRRGCGIQRALGDEVAIEKRAKNITSVCITGCTYVWRGCYLERRVLSSVIYGERMVCTFVGTCTSVKKHVRR